MKALASFSDRELALAQNHHLSGGFRSPELAPAAIFQALTPCKNW
jgi:hypothetical protein